MQLEHTFSNYKIFRFLFSFALLVAFSLFAGTEGIKSSSQIVSAFILFIYTGVSFFTIFISRVTIFDILLDITFISGFIFTDFNRLKYFSILYLFPLFFSGFNFKPTFAYTVSLITIIEYMLVFLLYEEYKNTGYLNFFLNSFAFIIITTAGIKLKEEIEKQQKYIKRLEEERRETQLYKKLYRISAELAHEIRNPLSSIKAAAELLSEGKVNPKLLNMIKEEAIRLNKLLSDFLLLSKPRGSEKVKINVKEMLNRIISLYDEKGIVELNILGNPYIFMDEKGFESAVSNVLKNAVEWARSSVVVNVYSTSEKLFIEIEDDGPGIKEEDKEKIFDPFFTRTEGGTGLGLAIAKKVVIENGGNIFVEKSKLGGAKFVLIFSIGRENESNSGR